MTSQREFTQISFHSFKKQLSPLNGPRSSSTLSNFRMQNLGKRGGAQVMIAENEIFDFIEYDIS
ncbi:hypothetical protein IX51_08500 [uncultured archaeon]|nr:hypothetical protein IX51_08500 [uncultured archaeon]